MNILNDPLFNTLSHDEFMEEYIPCPPTYTFNTRNGGLNIPFGDADQTLNVMAFMKLPWYDQELFKIKVRIEEYKRHNFSTPDISELYVRLAELQGIKEEAEAEVKKQDAESEGFNLNFSSMLSVTTTEIASVTGKIHKHVMRDTRDMISKLGKNHVDYVEMYIYMCPTRGKMSKNRYKLPAELYFTLMTGYSTIQRARMIDLWIELETKYLANIPLEDVIKLMRAIDGFVQIAKPIPDENIVYADITFDLSSLLQATTRYACAMTSSEIAKDVGHITDDGVVKRHDHVMRDIEVQFNELGQDLTPYIGTEEYRPYPNSKPRTRKVYILPRNAVLVLITGYLVRERYAVVRRLLVLQRGLDVTSQDVATLIEEQAVKQGCEVYVD